MKNDCENLRGLNEDKATELQTLHGSRCREISCFNWFYVAQGKCGEFSRFRTLCSLGNFAMWTCVLSVCVEADVGELHLERHIRG